MRRRSVVGGDSCACFPQTVGGAMTQSGLVAPLPEFVPETRVTERPPKIVHQEGEFSAERGVNYLLQCREDR